MTPNQRAEEIAYALERRHGWVDDNYPGYNKNLKDAIAQALSQTKREAWTKALDAVPEAIRKVKCTCGGADDCAFFHDIILFSETASRAIIQAARESGVELEGDGSSTYTTNVTLPKT
jgi:hypothetical protein